MVSEVFLTNFVLELQFKAFNSDLQNMEMEKCLQCRQTPLAQPLVQHNKFLYWLLRRMYLHQDSWN